MSEGRRRKFEPRVWAACFVALLGCEGGGGGLFTLEPELRVTPQVIRFDTVPLGRSVQAEVLLENLGTAELVVSALTSEGRGLGLADPPGTPLQIPTGGQAKVQVRYTAVDLQASTGALVIQSDDPRRPEQRVPIEITRRDGPVLVICVESAEIPLLERCGPAPGIDFGEVRPGQYRTAKVSLYSEGTAPVELTALSIVGEAGAGFSMVTTATGAIEPGQARSVLLRWAPSAEGPRQATLQLESSDGPRSLSLSGAGSEGSLCVSPAIVDFGRAAPGQTVEREINLSNCGSGELTVGSLTFVSGAEGVAVVEAPQLPLTLPPVRSLVLSVRLRWTVPEGVEGLEGRLRIGASPSSGVVSLEGRVSRGCELAIQPSRVDLDLRDTGRAELAVTNLGNQPCGIQRVEVTRGAEAFRAELAATLPHELRAGGTLTIAVETVAGAEATGELEVATLDAVKVVPLSASVQPISTGPCQINVGPDTLNFQDLAPGRMRLLPVQIGAGGQGSGACHLTSVSLTPTSHPSFTVVPGGVVTLVPPAATTVLIKFAPTAADGPVEATLRIASDDPNAPITEVALRGFAGGPALCVEPAAIDFGAGGGDAESNFQLVACGNRSVSIQALDWTRADPEIGLLGQPNLPLTLGPGDVVPVTVAYRPTDADGDTAVLEVRSDDPTRPALQVRVTGGASIVPPSAGRFLYLWRIFNGSGQSQESEISRMPLQGALELETYWGPRSHRGCTGCHNLSPDGRYVGLVEVTDQVPMLQVVDNLTQQAVPLASQAPISAGALERVLYFSWNPNVATNPPYQYVYAADGDLHLGSLDAGYLGRLAGADSPDFDETMPNWGPDGRIAFARGERDSSGVGLRGKAELFVVPEGGGVATRLLAATDPLSRYYPAFSPDGRWVAHTRSALGASTLAASDARIELVAADGSGDVRTLPELNADGAASYPHWSLDGRYLSFSSNRAGGQGGWDVYFAEIDSETGAASQVQPVPAANSPEFEHGAQWSP